MPGFNVNKCIVADTLLLHGAAEVSFQSAQRPLNDRSAEHDVAGITARICTTLEKLWKYIEEIILVHLAILGIVSSPPVKPKCDLFGAREIVNLTFLFMCLVLA